MVRHGPRPLPPLGAPGPPSTYEANLGLSAMSWSGTVLGLSLRSELQALPYGGSTIKAPKVLADIVESIAGAVYVDCSFDLEMLWKVIRGLLEPIVTLRTLDEQPVTALCEFCQKHGKKIRFKFLKRGTLNITNVFVDEELVGVGSSEQKLISKLDAARDARLRISGSEPTEMSIDYSFNEVEEKEGAKHKLGIHCAKRHWQKPVFRSGSDTQRLAQIASQFVQLV